MSTTKRTLEERGWVVFPSVIDPHECRGFLGALEGIWSDLHEPPLYSRTDVRYGADVLVSAVGFTVHRLLERLPGTRDLLLPEPVLRAVESVVGAEFVLDLVSGVLSDTSRPFFFWHHHVGGILEARDYLTQAVRYPRFNRIERLACTFYPTPLDDEHGVMLVHPRRVTDATDPPYADMDGPWPVQETIRCPAGSVLLADQSLWHAVTPMRGSGRRAFAAGFIVPGVAASR